MVFWNEKYSSCGLAVQNPLRTVTRGMLHMNILTQNFKHRRDLNFLLAHKKTYAIIRWLFLELLLFLLPASSRRKEFMFAAVKPVTFRSKGGPVITARLRCNGDCINQLISIHESCSTDGYMLKADTSPSHKSLFSLMCQSGSAHFHARVTFSRHVIITCLLTFIK